MNRRADLLLYAYCIYCIASTKADAKTPTATSAIAGKLFNVGEFHVGDGRVMYTCCMVSIVQMFNEVKLQQCNLLMFIEGPYHLFACS